MKRYTKTCLDCKAEEVVMVFTDIEIFGNKLSNIDDKCKKCGSRKVEFKRELSDVQRRKPDGQGKPASDV